jgi:hypothetical protein
MEPNQLGGPSIPERIKWEYHIEEGLMNRKVDLANIGRQGWELVSALVAEGLREFYFKRPLPGRR